jgi:hypothetical protein
MANLDFNANDVEPSNEYEPIPAGKYLAVITDSEMKPTKSGTGNYLQLAFQIIEGEFENRMLWVRLNLDNPNATAVQIARRELSAICRAIDVLTPGDSTDLHDLPVAIHVRVKRRNDTGELQNEIKGYSSKDGTKSESPKPPNAGNASATSESKPPWKR